MVPATALGTSGGTFEVDVGLGDLAPQPARRGSPVNVELVDCSLFTRNVRVGLEVFHICMLAYGCIPRGYNQVHSERMIAPRDACLARAHALDMGIAASTRATR